MRTLILVRRSRYSRQFVPSASRQITTEPLRVFSYPKFILRCPRGELTYPHEAHLDIAITPTKTARESESARLSVSVLPEI